MNLRLAATLSLILFAAGAARAIDPDPQETADHEGDQSGISDAEAAPPPEFSAPDEADAESAGNDVRPYDAAVKRLLGAGHWGVEVILIEPNGAVRQLAGLHENLKLMPASTMKVFTSWFGYVETLALRALGREPVFPTPWVSYEAYAAYTLKVSDNNKAMAILKKFAPTRGPAVLEKFYAGLGIETPGELKVVDGAGLATGNRATARLEVALLEHIRGSAHYDDYRAMLAEPGETGTLRNRLADLQGLLYAKTGTLTTTRVAALAGFLDAGAAGTVVFSIIGNNPRLTVDVQRRRIDSVVEELHRGVVADQRASAFAALALTRQKAVAARLSNWNAALP